MDAIRNAQPARAAAYLRVSRDTQATEPLQRAACTEQAQKRGWTIVGEYVDHGESAFAEKRERLAWEAMLADAAAGRFTAIIAAADDRLWRDYGEQKLVFAALASYGVGRIVASREYDTGSADDQALSAMAAVFGWQQSAATRRRVREAIEANVAGGVPNGGNRPFGYRRIYSDRQAGIRAALAVDEAEAAEIRAAAARILAGATVRSIVLDWRSRVPSVAGGQWTSASVKRAISAPRVAGLREWRGEVVGPAAWPAILDAETYERVRAVLYAPGRGPAGRAPRKHLLRGLIECPQCGQKLVTRSRADRPEIVNYVCRPASDGGCSQGGVACVAGAADAEIVAQVVARLAGPGLAAALEAAQVDADVVKVAGQLRADRARLDRLGVAWALEEITRAAYLEAKRTLEGRIAAAERQLAAAQQTSALAALPADPEALAAWFDAAPVADAHEVLRAVIERIPLRPARRGSNRFDPSRLADVVWRV